MATPSAKRSLNASIVVTRAPGTPIARKTHPVEIGVAEIEHVERLAARIAGPDIGELALEDRVAPVRE